MKKRLARCMRSPSRLCLWVSFKPAICYAFMSFAT